MATFLRPAGASIILVVITWIVLAHSIEPRADRQDVGDQQTVADTLGPDTITSTSFVGQVEFPHMVHIEDLEIECEECHHETNAAPLLTPHADYFTDFWINCNTCHHDSRMESRSPQACTDCHPDHASGVSDQTISAKVAVHLSCWECHDSGTGVEASETCVFCHTGPKMSF